MLKVLKYLKSKEWLIIFISFILIVAQVWLDLKLPDYMSDITMYIQTPGSLIKDIWISGGWMMLCALGSLASAVIVGFFTARVACSFSKRLRSLVFNKVIGFSESEINAFSTASLITRSTNDINQIQMFLVMGLQVLIKAPILAIFAILKIANKSWQWTAATGIFVLFLVIVIAIIIGLAIPKFKIIQTLTDNINRVTRENLTGLRVVRAYNAQSYQENKFEKANSDLTSTNLFTQCVMSVLGPVITLVLNGLSLAIYWIGSYIIDDAELMDKPGVFSDMVVFAAYAVQVVMAFMMLTMIFIILPRATVSARRIKEVLNTENSIPDGTFSKKTKETGKIEFKHVSFKYPDANEYALNDISFKANKGETVAFIGSTGSGKTTLINLIPRFYDISEGEVLVNGVDVKNYKSDALHNILGYVSQKAIIFTGTVASNVGYGDNGNKKYSLSDIKKAVKIAQGQEFVEKMCDSYNSPIAQGGSNVSGGQKQRIAIARAVCRKPQIYIFDDSFSALDYKTDRVLRSALKKETNGATNLIVAQRIGTIIDADRIIVLDEGKMVGMGTHKELMKSCSVYQEIAYSQLSKEELENEQ